MKLKLKDIRPNPFRDLLRNPLDRAKVVELIASINDTGFWDNVVVRKNKSKEFELAYGHHRVQAALEAGITEADFIVKDLSDAMMIKIMTNENSEAYGYSFLSTIESVRAVVTAYSEGSLSSKELVVPKDTPESSKRFAPSYIQGKQAPPTSEVERPYTVASVAEFLGLTKARGDASNKVTAAFGVLELSERGILGAPEESLKDTPIKDILKMVSDLKKRHEAVIERRNKDQVEVAKLQTQRAEKERKDRELTAKHKAEQERLLKQQAEALRKKNEEEAERALKEAKDKDERFQKRQEANKVSRRKLDADIKATQERVAEQKEKEKDLPTRHQVATFLWELKAILSPGFAFREKIKALSRNKAVTTNEREIIRQAMLDAGDWYQMQANEFLPIKHVDPLAEAQRREELQRKTKKESL